MSERESPFYPITVDARGKSAPKGWRWQKLTSLARLESGHTPSRLRLDWWGGDISWLSLTEIRALDGQWVEETNIKTNSDGIANSAARILPVGTVCLSRTASVGFVAIMAKPMATSQDFANWVCGDDIDPEYLMYSLICARPYLRDLSTGATHKTIYMPTLTSFHVCLPSLENQKSIAKLAKNGLKEIDVARRAAEKQLQEVLALPEILLQEAFGGY